MERKFSIKTVLMLLAASLLMVAGTYMTVALYLAAVLLAFCFVSYGSVLTVVAVLAGLGGTAFLGEPSDALIVAAMVIPSTVILSILLKKKCSYRSAVIGCVTAILIETYLITFLPSILQGYNINHVTDAYMLLGVEVYETTLTADVLESIKPITDNMVIYSAEIVFTSLMLSALSAGFLQVVIAHALYKEKLQLAPMAKFKDWQLPTSFMWGSLILIVSIIVMSGTSLSYKGIFIVICTMIILCPLALVGLSCSEFFIQILPEGKGMRRVITYGLLILCFPYCIFMLALYAVTDKIFKLRKRIIVIRKDQ